jgi:hypothetical protein
LAPPGLSNEHGAAILDHHGGLMVPCCARMPGGSLVADSSGWLLVLVCIVLVEALVLLRSIMRGNSLLDSSFFQDTSKLCWSCLVLSTKYVIVGITTLEKMHV